MSGDLRKSALVFGAFGLAWAVGAGGESPPDSAPAAAAAEAGAHDGWPDYGGAAEERLYFCTPFNRVVALGLLHIN